MKLKALSKSVAIVFTFCSITILGLGLFELSHAKAKTNACEGKAITIFGDSLTAGYGLNPGEGFPEQLQKALNEKGSNIKIINAGVSGDTTSGGLARLEWSLAEKTDAVVIELGANDALRGISPEVTRENLEQMIMILKDKNIEVMLAGMLAPPNMGAAYAEAFNPIYKDLSQKHETMLYPFFLEGVVADLELNQADGIHPTKEGIAVIVDNFMPSAEQLISKVCNQ